MWQESQAHPPTGTGIYMPGENWVWGGGAGGQQGEWSTEGWGAPEGIRGRSVGVAGVAAVALVRVSQDVTI